MLTLAKFKSEIKNDISRINKIINSTLLSTKEPKLVEIYTHINKQQGKQIRASLMILIDKLNKQVPSKNLNTIAAAVELIHLASLIHDDIIDMASVRRMQETINAKFGTNNAIISGVHAYAKALQLIAQVGNLEILEKISQTVNNLCEGESNQVNQRHNYNLSINEYWNIIDLKTASLFKTACECSAILNNYPKNVQKLFSEFGNILGIIFQVTDDYLDIFDTKNKLSKKIEQDFKTGDISLPMLIAIKNEPTQLTPFNQAQVKELMVEKKQFVIDSLKTIILEKKELAQKKLNLISNETQFNLKYLEQILELITNRI